MPIIANLQDEATNHAIFKQIQFPDDTGSRSSVGILHWSAGPSNSMENPTPSLACCRAGSAFDRAFNQIWLSLAFQPENMTRNFHWFGSVAKLKSGITIEQARTQMDAIGARIAQTYPESNKSGDRPLRRHDRMRLGRTTLAMNPLYIGQ